MIAPEFFSRLGAFVQKRFLDPESCASLRQASRASSWRQATIGEAGSGAPDAEIRRTRRFQIDERHVELVRDRLLALKPSLERHFEVSLEGVENPQFLGYRVGDFYRPHHDDGGSYRIAPQINRRLVSIVVFLNAVGEAEDSYEGGELVLYGMLGDERLASKGLALRAEEGLLVAFRSTLLHEVSVVTRGERFSIATWFY